MKRCRINKHLKIDINYDKEAILLLEKSLILKYFNKEFKKTYIRKLHHIRQNFKAGEKPNPIYKLQTGTRNVLKRF